MSKLIPTTLLKLVKNRFLALVGGIFHRNGKIQKTKVIYFMFGTYCWLGVPKIQKVQIITPPPTLVKNGMNEVGWEIREKAEDYYFVSFAFSLVSQPIL